MKAVFDEGRSGKLNMSENVVGTDEEVIDLGQLWRFIARAKFLILFVTILCAGIGLYSAKNMVPMYKASAKILADPQSPRSNLEQRNIPGNIVALYYKTQYEIINSRKISESVVDKLGLVEKYKNDLRTGVLSNDSNSLVSTFIEKTGLSVFFEEQDKKETVIDDTKLRVDIASGIQGNLEVSGGEQSQVIDISFQSTNPKYAALIVNTISESYIQFGLDSRLGEVKNTENWLSKQSALLKTTLIESEEKLSQYRIKEGLVDTEQQQTLVSNQLQSLNNELINAQTRLSETEEQYLAIKNVEPGSKELYSLGPVLDNESTSALVREQGILLQRVNELFDRYGEKHPTMISARSELKSTTENLAIEVNKVLENIEKQYQLAKVQVSNIQKLINQTKETVQSTQGKNFSLVSLERDVENNRRIYDNFQVSLLEANVIRDFDASNVSIIDSATVPKYPFKPNTKLILIMSIVFGFMLGVLLAILREVLNNTLKTPDDIERKLSLSTVGITPIVKGKGPGVKAPELQYLDDSLTPFSESINTIRTGLIFSNIDSPPKTLLITSANSGEGKSTLAINLASAFSHLGKTLLLEVDLRKPSIAKTFGYKAKPGFTDVLTGIENLNENIIVSENNGNLHILVCGSLIHNPLDLLSSNKFEETLSLLKDSYEYIVLDGPPTLPVSDSCILANKVDGVIFAIKSNSTKVKLAEEAITRLQSLNANVIGAVLTVADPKKMSDYGEHFYSGEYYGERPEKVGM